MGSIFLNQINLLLWKNFCLIRRRPTSLVVEMLIPLFIVFILVGVRRIQPQTRMDLCDLREKQMASMGPIPFIRDFLCTYNTTCYNQTQMNWNDTSVYNFQIFLNNISTVYNNLPPGNFNAAATMSWFQANPIYAAQLENSLTYFATQISPILTAVNKVMSGNSSDKLVGINTLGALVCGVTPNDLSIFNNLLLTYATANKSIPSCQKALQYYFQESGTSSSFYNIIAPLIFGNIYYTPNSPFTQLLMTQANTTFVTLDNLRLAAVQWRLNFQAWFLNASLNDPQMIQLRSITNSCVVANGQNASFCQSINNTIDMNNITYTAATVSFLFTLIESALNCTVLNKFVPLPTPDDISNLANLSTISVLAGVVFNASAQYFTPQNATFLSYQIRMPTSKIDSTTNFKVLDTFWTPSPRISPTNSFKYYTSGFLWIQEAIDQAFVSIITGNGPTSFGSSMQIMPYPCYVVDPFISFLANTMPFLIIIAWVPSLTVLLKSIVYEKEIRLKEYMQVMGLNNFVHWLGWFVTTFVILIFPVTFMTILLKVGNIMQYTSFGVIIILLFSYVISLICQAFMLSVFFNKANVASVTGGIIYFICYTPFLVFVNLQDSLGEQVFYAVGLLNQVALANSINFIAYWEQATIGAQFSNLLTGTITNINFGVGHCIVMMYVDSAIYLLITWYVESVFPGEYGVPRPWYFLFTRNYWCSSKTDCNSNEINPIEFSKIEISNVEPTNQPGFEVEPSNLTVGISIQDLVKIYSKDQPAAVNNLNLNFYQSQITAFLGHNGAGKTTTISILTGIFAPSSGTAYILGQDIRYNLDIIRQKLGLCPQHNILFDDLTVEDHVYFYGLLKGMKKSEIKEILPKIVEDVGLTKKIDIASKNLSGGMKRKLSVAMAFVGDSRVVFLDEPTAGIDPFARRGIWDLLMKYRNADRTIILTTHHMDEADYLSDRIAIISQGKLQCCGSSVFLKKVYGEGYYLILVKHPDICNESFEENRISKSGEKVLAFIQRYINDARLSEETRTQLSIVLPQNDTNSHKFSNLFEKLDQSLKSLNILSYGLSDTSLEEVFLKVANDPSGKVEEIKDKKITAEDLDILTENGVFPRPASVLSLRNKSDRSLMKDIVFEPIYSNEKYELLTGFSLLFQQITGLLIKRFHYTRRNIKGFVSELILPVLIILLIICVLQLTSPLTNQPAMVISPWLMMPKTGISNLNTFYRREIVTDPFVNTLEQNIRSDLGESGVRCMDPSVYRLPNLVCYPNSNSWSAIPQSPISLSSPDCDCSTTGNQQCSDPTSGGPTTSNRTMLSSDILSNVTGYNISDYLTKRFRKFIKNQYGGYQILLPSNFGQSSSLIGQSPLWGGMQGYFNSSQMSSNLNPLPFLNVFQTFYNLSGIKTKLARIWINSKGYVSMTSYANILSNLLLRASINTSIYPSNYGISVTNFPLAYSQTSLLTQINQQMFLEMSLAIFMIFGLSLIPASFVIFLIEERITGSKRQQFVSGVNPYVYWFSNFFWDIIKYMIPVIIIIIILVAFNYQSYIGAKNVGAFITLLIFYGLAIIPHMYSFSFFLSTPSTAFVVLNAYNLLAGAITTIATFLLDLTANSNPAVPPINNVLQNVFLIFPQYDLGRGMMNLSYNYLVFNASGGKIDYDPFSWNGTGQKLCSLSILLFFWWCVVILVESGVVQRSLYGKLKNYSFKHKEVTEAEDFDVSEERQRIISNENSHDVLKVLNLTKIYNASFNVTNKCCRKALDDTLTNEKTKLAVNNLCFGVNEGECFGLLGVNGAGKTTTFKMLTGEEGITNGNALINGYSIIDDMISAHKNMGFCPQFDALHDLLTCEEQLYLYCRLRGIEPSKIASCVESNLKNLSLIPHTTKTTQTLSGGNKRKLSTAIALIGLPKVIFLDEPTSGMDAGARRFLWNVIQRLTNENKISVILTSHNMEECEVLCHRLSIMVNGVMKCVGSVQHLKSKFGDNYYVNIRTHYGINQTTNREDIKSIINTEFKEVASLKEETSVTLQYEFNSSSVKLSTIFDFFENLKNLGTILDYSVSQTSLDDVFINFARDEGLTKIPKEKAIESRSQNEMHDNENFEMT